jgi:hypothetical protein
VACGGISFARRTEQFIAQDLRVRLCQPESRPKDASLVPPTRVRQVQAVGAELEDVHDGMFAARQLHYST